MELGDFTLADYIVSLEYLDGKVTNVDVGRVAHSPSVFIPQGYVDNSGLSWRLRSLWIVGLHVARGLEFMHRRQHVHRDLKPSNSICP